MKGVAIDVDPMGETIVVVPADQVDEAFREFVRSDEYLDWLEEAHSDEVDFPYTEPLMIDAKEYSVKIYRVRGSFACRIGDDVDYDTEQVIEEIEVLEA